MRSSRTSFRSRASSSRSSVVSPVLPFVRSARACSTQLRKDDSVSPRSRAAAATVFPCSSTSRTAPALKSSVKLRRVRRGVLCAILDIVSTFPKVSTKSDQAQTTTLEPFTSGMVSYPLRLIRTTCSFCSRIFARSSRNAESRGRYTGQVSRLVVEVPVSDRRTLGGLSQFLSQFEVLGSSTGP